MNKHDKLKKLIIHTFGSQVSLARHLDIECSMTVYQWFRSGRHVPVMYCPRIVELSNGAIALSDLRADVYPAPDQSAA